MRIASRIVGIVLALAGLVFLFLSVLLIVTYRPESVLEESRPNWTAAVFSGAMGMVLVLAGWYYFRSGEVQEWPTSRFAPYFIAHRRQLKVVAQIGLVISLIRLGAACFGEDWGLAATWALVLLWIALVAIGYQIAKPHAVDLDWESVPERMRPVLKAALRVGSAVFLILWLLLVWNQWSHLGFAPILRAGFAPLIFSWESLFFAYGKGQSDGFSTPAQKNTNSGAGIS